MEPKDKNYVIIDTQKFKEIIPPGLLSPKDKISYHHPTVQKIVDHCFKGMFPSIVQAGTGIAYQSTDGKGHDRCMRSVPCKNIADIPKSELLRLMEGWIRLRRHLQDENVSKKVQSILLNLKLPDPKTAIQQYRIDTVLGSKQLIVFWAFETEAEPSISIEKALSFFLDVPVGHLQSILSTSMSPHTGSVTQAVRFDPKLVQTKQQHFNSEESTAKGKSLLVPFLAVCAILFLAVGFIVGDKIKGKENSQDTPQQEDRSSYYTTSENLSNQPQAEPPKQELKVTSAPVPDLLGDMLGEQEKPEKSEDLLSSMVEESSEEAPVKPPVDLLESAVNPVVIGNQEKAGTLISVDNILK